MNEEIYQRSEILLGKENISILKNSHILICGIGGVGSYALEAIARSGIGKITIIDKDIVDITNINRQLIATFDTVGKEKVKIAKERINSINPKIEVKAICENITKENIQNFFDNKTFNYIIDCVDNMEAKVAIILEAQKRNIKCISSMGMGNRLNPLGIKVADIYKTDTCPLARKLRKILKENKIKKQKVVYSTEIPKKKTEEEKMLYGNTLGSVSFVPSVAGLVIASEVIKDLLK